MIIFGDLLYETKQNGIVKNISFSQKKINRLTNQSFLSNEFKFTELSAEHNFYITPPDEWLAKMESQLGFKPIPYKIMSESGIAKYDFYKIFSLLCEFLGEKLSNTNKLDPNLAILFLKFSKNDYLELQWSKLNLDFSDEKIKNFMRFNFDDLSDKYWFIQYFANSNVEQKQYIEPGTSIGTIRLLLEKKEKARIEILKVLFSRYLGILFKNKISYDQFIESNIGLPMDIVVTNLNQIRGPYFRKVTLER